MKGVEKIGKIVDGAAGEKRWKYQKRKRRGIAIEQDFT